MMTDIYKATENMWINNAKVFMDTRNKSQTLYSHDTNLLLANTQVYSDPDLEISDSDIIRCNNMDISVVFGGTVSTAYAIKNDGCRVAMLDFADAKRPGGWVVEGAQTQEENMCRCTNLYETLVQKKCLNEYYDFNLEHGVPDAENHYDEPYTDALIYAENVAIFKDDSTYKDIPIKYVDVIVSPAPCGKCDNLRELLLHRMRGIVKSAYMHKVTHLVLGAWGCGAFLQKPRDVANCFAVVLKEFPVFESVIFAIRPTVSRNNKVVRDKTFVAFDTAFKKPLF